MTSWWAGFLAPSRLELAIGPSVVPPFGCCLRPPSMQADAFRLPSSIESRRLTHQIIFSNYCIWVSNSNMAGRAPATGATALFSSKVGGRIFERGRATASPSQVTRRLGLEHARVLYPGAPLLHPSGARDALSEPAAAFGNLPDRGSLTWTPERPRPSSRSSVGA